MSAFSFRRLVVTLATLVVCFSIATPSIAFFDKSTAISPVEGEVRVKGSAIATKGEYFHVSVDEVKVVFFAVRDPQGAVHVALDACDACWPAKKGYKQDGEFFVCNNCSMRFHVSRIGLRKGGCNPHPLPFVEQEGLVIIPLDEIKKGVSYFK